MMLGRFEPVVQDTSGNGIQNASIEVRRQGANVKLNQTVTSGSAINVDDVGALVTGDVDTVVIVSRTGTVGSTQYNVHVVSRPNRTVTLDGYSGSLVLSDEDRLSPINNLPTLYADILGNETVTNALTTGSDGLANTDSKGCWMRGGWYDYILSGSSFTSRMVRDLFIMPRGEIFYANDPRYSAKGDGSTDDYAAIQRAIDDCYIAGADGFGGIVYLSRGIYMSSAQIVLYPYVTLVGDNVKSTIIRANNSFPSSTALVRLGDSGSTLVYGCRAQALTVDCNDVAGSIGIYSTGAAENSGVNQVQVVRALAKGIYFTGSNVGNCAIRDTHVLMSDSASAGSAIGIHLESCGQVHQQRVTVARYSGSGATNMLVGVKCDTASGRWSNLENTKIESATTGVHVTAGNFRAHGVTGNSSTPTLVKIASGVGQVMLETIHPNGSATSLSDLNKSITLTGDIAQYTVGHQTTGNLYSSNENVPWVIKSALTLDGAMDFNSTVNIDGALTTNSTVTANGAVTLNSTLDVNGASTFDAQADFKRLKAQRGTALATGDVVLTGWGSVSGKTVSGYDTNGKVTFTAGSISAGPSLAVTYKDGAFTNAPIVHFSVWGLTDDANNPGGIGVNTITKVPDCIDSITETTTGFTVNWSTSVDMVSAAAYQMRWFVVE